MVEQKLPNAGAHMLTISTTAVDLETAIAAAASTDFSLDNDSNFAEIVCLTQSIRVMSDGNTPTAANGRLLDVDVATAAPESIVFNGSQVKNIKLIRAGGANASVYVRVGSTRSL